jgi:hypothetical protein
MTAAAARNLAHEVHVVAEEVNQLAGGVDFSLESVLL